MLVATFSMLRKVDNRPMADIIIMLPRSFNFTFAKVSPSRASSAMMFFLSLLKREINESYPDKAIINALLTPKGKTIYSLRAPHLIAIIEQEEKKLEAENKTFTKEVERKDRVSHAKHNIKKGIISKLKDLE